MSFKIVSFLLFIAFAANAQQQGLHIKKAKAAIILDGEMKESDWQEAEVADHFKQYFPFDSSYAKAPTEVRMTYDDHAVYLFAIMRNSDSVARKYITPSLKRDFRGEANDAFVAVFDTYLDRTNAFQFGVNPFGVQREGLIANGGARSEDLSLNWDNKWYSESKILKDHWVCEMAIPFKTLRFKEGLSSWYINFYRIDSKHTERSVWTPVSRAYPVFNLAVNRELIWDQPLKNPGSNLSIIPYAAGKIDRNFEAGTPTDSKPDFGVDAKVAVGPALNLDLTVNPDFSQVEVDQQVTNLDRFEIFYPEKRQFFLENADLFGNFGHSNIRPFFSRRIGVTRDPSTGQNIQNRIYGGARLSGKINNNWRLGILNMQAAEDTKIQLPSINYSVAAVQRRIFSRSNVGVIMINKQAFHDVNSTKVDLLPDQYNRMVGVDFNLASKDNRWNGKAFYHRSFDQAKKDSAYATTVSLVYQVPKLEIWLTAQEVGANYNPEVGYVRRRHFKRVAPEIYYNLFPKSKIINSHGPGADFDFIGNEVYGLTDWDANAWYRFRFQNTSMSYIRLRREYVYLFSPFDPSGSSGLQLAAGNGYTWNSIILSHASNARKKFYYYFESRIGEYYNGHRQNVAGTLNYRFQPYAIISMDVSYNRIRLPQPYNNADLVLIGPKFDITFSRKLFWTTYLQYNNQIDNLNINSRLQWRFKPVSDFFLVYTDNYFAEANRNGDLIYLGQPKLRALVAKFTYWINL